MSTTGTLKSQKGQKPPSAPNHNSNDITLIHHHEHKPELRPSDSSEELAKKYAAAGETESLISPEQDSQA